MSSSSINNCIQPFFQALWPMPNGDKQLCWLYVTMVTSTIQALKIILFGKAFT